MFRKVDDLLEYDRSKVLRRGGLGIVFKGNFDRKEVAVKRTELFHTTQLSDIEEILRSVKHPNVAQIQYIAMDVDFRYDVTELYAASLQEYISSETHKQKFESKMPLKEQVLLQLANGLNYLHSLSILHGDIRPENILMSITTPLQMKWSDFGLNKLMRESFSLSETVLEGRKWSPPETYEFENLSPKGEIFSTGCVFLYFISDGCHPFALPGQRASEISKNVVNGHAVNLIDLSNGPFEFIKLMIKKNPEERMALWDVINRLENLQRSTNIDFSSLVYVDKSYLNGKYSFGLYVSVSEKLAVRRIPTDYPSTTSFEEFKKLNHSNVVRILNFNEQDSFKYYRLECCVASMEQLFLPEGHAKKYQGPIPSHEQVFFQLFSGLQYIHSQNFVHGSIKSSTVLISSSDDPQIKLSDFGLTPPRLDNGNGLSTITSTGFQSDFYWMAPELRQDLNIDAQIPTKESDVYSAGKFLFFYWNRFYADLSESGDKQNFFKKLPRMEFTVISRDKNRREHFPFYLSSEMTKEDSKTRLEMTKVIEIIRSRQLTPTKELEKPQIPRDGNSIDIRNIQFSRDHVLGEGGFATVYLGLWGSEIAAIKRINTTKFTPEEIEREMELKNFNHRNIVKFYDSEEDDDFKYIAMEKCLVSFSDYCRQPQLYHGVIPMPSDQQVLLQMAEGLEYIHSRNLIHRDVKPGNILISAENPAVIKFADFGLAKYVLNRIDEVTWTMRQGTEGWMAPEVEIKSQNPSREEKVKAGQKSDIFALGCVFFFFLVPGIHPFGNNKTEIKKNIKSGNQHGTNVDKLPENHFAFNVIKEMIAIDQRSRPEIADVVKELKSDGMPTM